MPDPTIIAERPDTCPRCGARLHFEDEDGTVECTCGWSERMVVSELPKEPADASEDAPPDLR